MAKLTSDEAKLLEELTARANEPDEDDYEIEIYDTEKKRGARIPVSKGKSWLFENFGIGDAPAAPETREAKEAKTPHGTPTSEGPKHYFAGNKGE
jgi:hypothetical protein